MKTHKNKVIELKVKNKNRLEITKPPSHGITNYKMEGLGLKIKKTKL
jgi:hypothetical protein